jgi:hypothetical protein
MRFPLPIEIIACPQWKARRPKQGIQTVGQSERTIFCYFARRMRFRARCRALWQTRHFRDPSFCLTPYSAYACPCGQCVRRTLTAARPLPRRQFSAWVTIAR